PPRARGGRPRFDASEPRLLRAADRPRELAIARDPRRSARPRRAPSRRARAALDALPGSAAGGVHVATMGGLWQALVYGFAGVRPSGDRLIVDPRLPPQGDALELSLHFRGETLRGRHES